MTQEKINALESRQLELLGQMSSSDAHAAKCTKKGTSFGEEYPDELAAYLAANKEYNENETALAQLYEQLKSEEENPEIIEP